MAMFNSYVSLPEGKHVESEESKTANVCRCSCHPKLTTKLWGLHEIPTIKI